MAGGVRAVQIDGLVQLQRDLRQLDAALPKELRKVNLDVAKLVAQRAQARARGLGGVNAAAAGSIKALAQQRNAAVQIRATAAIPFALGAEFGAGHDSRRHRKTGMYRGYNQFPIWRGNGADAGYAVYPTIRDSNSAIVEAYQQRLTELLTEVFPN